MNREIKFKWVGRNLKFGTIRISQPMTTLDLLQGNWETFFSLDNRLEGGNCYFLAEIECTGVLDKNVNYIYESDIVTSEYGKGKVVFNAGCFMIQWIDDVEAMMELLSIKDYKYGRLRQDIEVIGNVYLTPELLTK